MNVSIQERKEIEKKDIDNEILENYIETVTKEEDEENVYLIYKIVFPNGKHYIGLSTRALDERKKEHRNSAIVDKPKQIVHKALKKFDMIDTFELIEIDNTAKSINELYEKEIFYIQQYNSYYKNKKGYNMTLGGDGNHGYVRTKADRKKFSEAQLQRYSNPEEKEKASQIKKEYHKNNPEAGKVHGEKIKEHFQNNPEAREKARERTKEHYKNNPEARKCEKNRKLFKVFRKHNMEFIKEFEFQFEAIEYIKKEFNVNVLSSKISNVLQKKRKSTGGFVFKYVE